ncbi:hypothetical protein DFH06DRAFT_1464869 [Mycena polygramma]|nr:hypothetical protein DFH06DRAFT_1464869 [Mycena polygramma]
MNASLPHATIPSKGDVQVQIETAEANILRLTAQIDELDRTRQEERRTLGRLWSPIGPDHPVHQTIILSQICSSWRQVVLSSPKLWTAGVVDVRMNGKNNLDIVRYLLDRSAPLPISVSLTRELNAARQLNESYGPPIPDLSQVVPSTASRHFRISLGPFTALEDLDLQYGHSQSTPIDLFFRCPLLRRLILRPDLLRSPCDAMLHFSWAQLTHLDLLHGNSVTAQSILLQCTNIVSTILTICEWGTNSSIVHAHPSVLPFLTTLKADFHDSDATGAGRLEPFFMPFTLPALQALDLTFFGDAAWPAQEFTAFQILTHLELAPALTALTLRGCTHCLDRDFLRAFRYAAGTHPLVPQLQMLDLDLAWIDDLFDIEGLEAAIRSRRWTANTAPPVVGQLRVVRMRLPLVFRISSAVLRNRMRDLVDLGLQLNIG